MRHKYTKELLEEAVLHCITWSDVCRYFNVAPATGSASHLRRRADFFGIDYSHFKGQAWSKGDKRPPKRKIEDYLSGKYSIKSQDLKLRLIRQGYKKHECESCGLTEWMSNPIPIELDHIDGNNKNNQIDNLRILCPNCHALTITYCRKK